MSTNLVERVTKSTICMLVCGVVTGCDKLDLHGDPSDSMEITRVPARWSPAWICFSLLLSSSLVFLNPVKLISIISYRDEVWHVRGKAWDWLLFLFLNAFFGLVPSSRSWLYSIKQRFYHWSIFARKATKVVFHSFCRGKLTVIRVASIFTWKDRGVCTARQTSFAAHLKVKTINTFTSRVVRGFANS